jgi:hypothetical protein
MPTFQSWRHRRLADELRTQPSPYLFTRESFHSTVINLCGTRFCLGSPFLMKTWVPLIDAPPKRFGDAVAVFLGEFEGFLEEFFGGLGHDAILTPMSETKE